MLLNTLLGIELSPVVFRFGNLKVRQNYLQGGNIYDGSAAEEEKYKDYLQLKRHLSEITILDLFCKPFQNVLVLPLIIKNVLKYVDRNIKTKITVEGDGNGNVLSEALYRIQDDKYTYKREFSYAAYNGAQSQKGKTFDITQMFTNYAWS